MGINVKYGPEITPSGVRNYDLKGSLGSTVSYMPTYFSSFMRGETIANFYKKKRSGALLPHTPFEQYAKSETSFTAYDVRLETIGNPNERWLNEGVNCSHWPSPKIYHAPDTSSAGYYLQQAAANIYSQGFDALTAIAELGDVKRMFRSAAKKAHKLLTTSKTNHVRGLKKANAQDFGPAFDAATSAWLTYRYGVRPLINDVESLLDAINNYDAQREIYSQRNGTSYTVSTTNPKSYYAGSVWGNWLGTDTWVTTHSIRGSVTAKFQPARISANALVTGWEVVPFSFMVDWVYGVGVALQAASLQFAAQAITASTGVHSKTTYLGVIDEATPGSGKVYAKIPNTTCSWEMEQSIRTPSSIPTLPQLTNRALDPQIQADLVALSRAIMGKKSTRSYR